MDAIPADFVAGVVERMVLDAARDADIVLVEGQGAIHHPAYSGVTLALMHGSCAEALVLCHQAGRTHMKLGDAGPAPRIRPLSEVIRDNERAAGWVRTAPVLGLAINTMMLDDLEARRTLEHTSQLTRTARRGPGAVRCGGGCHGTDAARGRTQATRVERMTASPSPRPHEGRGGTRMRLTTEPLELKTVFEFRIAHGSRRAHRNTLVRLSHAGIEGLGEAAPSHYYGETAEQVDLALAAWAPELGDDPFALDAIDQRLDAVLHGQHAARAAIEMALHDWIGKKLGLPVWKLFGLDAARAPRSCVTLGMASPEEMEQKLETVKDFPMLKVKLGRAGRRGEPAAHPGELQGTAAGGREHGVERGRRRARAAPDRAAQIELVEQPVPRGDLDGLRWVRERSPIPVFADESAHSLADIGVLAGRVDGVNLKIMKTGGLREMQRMIHAARAHGMKVMLGSMVETSLALSAAAQLAPLVDYLDLDGHWLLRDDPFSGSARASGASSS